MKAVQVWKDGCEWWEVWNGRDIVEIVSDREEAARIGADEFTTTDEPRFLVRDESGRGFANEFNYSEFTTEERGHIEDEDEPDDTFGEWLDNSSAGDEYRNTDENYTVIRIN